MRSSFLPYLHSNTEAAPLAVFRIFFGVMMFGSIVRFWANGWIEKLYIDPNFHFTFYGFEFVKPLGGWTYVLFILCGLSALGITVGYRYRLSVLLFFLSFTYIELMDKTTYLNHYYFISILSFLMLFLPAGKFFSIDAKRNPESAFQYIPKWNIDAVKLLLAIVYFYAGLAKLNSDWLLEAMPLKIWLPSKYDLPFLGDLLQKEWAHYAFSWAGAIYDLSIPFLLLYRKTRIPAFITVIVFHVLTRVLFPIGMFPYIMILSATIFFDANFHRRVLAYISKLIGSSVELFENGKALITQKTTKSKLRMGFIGFFFAFQILFPFRNLLYPGELFWTEQGFRFSWRVMLMEKAGYANFKIVEPESGKRFYVDNQDFLTAFQEKQMATQPDFILEYAHFLKEHFESQGHRDVQVFVESYVALNGRLSQPFIDPDVDLTQFKESFKHKHWILPFNDEIYGL